MENNLEGILSNNQLSAKASAAKSQEALGKDDFLKLMMLQMKHQDPLNPMDNQAMLSQMAQFSSLEQMSNLNSNLSKKDAVAGFMDATRLLGKTVDIVNTLDPSGEGKPVSSKVKSVNHGINGPVLTLENGSKATVDQVLKVSEEKKSQS